MNLSRRIARMERQTGLTGPCPLCGGKGGGRRIFIWQLNQPEPRPAGCAACGKQAVYRLVRLQPEPGWIEQP